MFWVIASAAAALWIVVNGVIIVLQRRSAAATIAWLTVLVFLPVIGMIIYTLIGPLRLERRRRKRELAKRLVDEGLRGLSALDSDRDLHQLAMVPIGLGGAPSPRRLGGALFDGISTYRAILDAVRAALIIHVGTTSGSRYDRDPARALIERARAGVKVRSSSTAPEGASVAQFLKPSAMPARRSRGSTRCTCTIRRPSTSGATAKIVVCDGRVAFTGMNITDVHSAGSRDVLRHASALRPCRVADPARVLRGLVLRRRGDARGDARDPAVSRVQRHRARADRVLRTRRELVRDPQDVLRADQPRATAAVADEPVLRPRRRAADRADHRGAARHRRAVLVPKKGDSGSSTSPR
jgi:phosphatidylserine/phosphatidylglycerophosphate/cardiolipin synthase-like enzyme